MAKITPFLCIRPEQNVASKVAALPYDVYNRQEACEEVKREPLSFLGIDRPETQFDDSVDTYDQRVYEKARDLLNQRIDEGIFLRDNEPAYFVYELTMEGRAQTGIVACASIDDYLSGVIKKHENTREEKELDRICHVDICNAQTGPIFLAYRHQKKISAIVEETKQEAPVYAFIASDGVLHRVWKLDKPDKVASISNGFVGIQEVYIADGHHRAASAVKVGLKRRQEHPDYSGEEEFNRFLSVLFPDNELKILPYNRAISDLNGYSKEEFLDKIRENFLLHEVGKEPVAPPQKATFGMYLEDTWYLLVAKEVLRKISDPVESLDVAILQNYLLRPILGIEDPRTDQRIDFIGGIRGAKELEKRVHEDMKVAFVMYPTSIEELFLVSDAGKLMPPKSTWFEPKLRSGLFIHSL